MAKLPTVTSIIPKDLRRFIDRIRDAFDGSNRVITQDDLIGTGVFSKRPDGRIEFDERNSYCGIPPAPTNVVASGAMTSILLEWEGWRYNCKAYAEIHRADVDDIGLAVLVGTANGGLYSDAVGSNATHYYWVRLVNTEGVVGPFNQTAGTKGETAPDIEYLLEMLSDQLSESELNEALNSRIDLIDGDPQTAGTIPYQIKTAKAEAINDAGDAADNAITTAINTYNANTVSTYVRNLEKKITDGDELVSGEVTDLSLAIYGNPNADPDDPDAIAGSLATLQNTIETTAANTYATSKDQDALVAAIYGPDFDINNPLTLDQLTSGTIYNEREVRASQFETLAQSIEVLTVGAGEGIDAVHTWFYDDSLEQWKGYRQTISNYSGFLRVNSIDTSVPTSAFITTTTTPEGTSMSFSGATYNHIRIRGRRVEGTSDSWNFRIQYRTDGTWKTGYTDTARDISVGEYFVINADMSNQALWTGGTIEGIRIYMSNARNDRFDIDYVTIGRLGAAASTATVLTEREARIDADAVQAKNLQTLESKYNGADAWITSFDETYSNKVADQADQFTAAKSLKALQTELGNARSWIASYDDTFTDANTSAATTLKSLGSELGTTTAWINTLDDTFSSKDGSTAYSLNQLSTTLNGATSAIETHAESIDGLKAQYTVKVDNNGYVSGFGIASTTSVDGVTGIPGETLSEFSIVADKFSIAPVGTDWSDNTDQSPFFYLTKETTINNEVIPPGAYMKSAYIHDAAITNAKIGKAAVDDAKISSLSAAKVTFGEMDGDRIKANTLKADRIDVDTIAAYLANIETAYITDAHITKAAIKEAQIDTGAITSAKIDSGAITDAKINKAEISGAKIKSASIDSLQIKGQAVTFTVGTFYSAEISSGSQTTSANRSAVDATITCSGAPILISASMFCRWYGDIDGLKQTTHYYYVDLYRVKNGSSTKIYTGLIGYVNVRKTNTYAYGLGSVSVVRRDTPGEGEVKYQLYIRSSYNGMRVQNRSMVLSELKR